MAGFSVKKPLTIFVTVLGIIVLGVVAYLKMTPDLLPNMDFPYVIIVTSDPGASPESIEQSITRPVEQSMATLDKTKTVTSTSQDSVSMVIRSSRTAPIWIPSVWTSSRRSPYCRAVGTTPSPPLRAEDQSLHAAGDGGRRVPGGHGRVRAQRFRHRRAVPLAGGRVRWPAFRSAAP